MLHSLTYCFRSTPLAFLNPRYLMCSSNSPFARIKKPSNPQEQAERHLRAELHFSRKPGAAAPAVGRQLYRLNTFIQKLSLRLPLSPKINVYIHYIPIGSQIPEPVSNDLHGGSVERDRLALFKYNNEQHGVARERSSTKSNSKSAMSNNVTTTGQLLRYVGGRIIPYFQERTFHFLTKKT